MADIKPVGLGDEPAVEFKTIFESYPIPEGGRKGLLSFVDHILSAGGVQKMVIEIGKPLQFWRKVKAAEEGEDVPEELLEDDLVAAARNTDMEELIFQEPLSAFEYLFRAFDVIESRRLVVKAIMVSSPAESAAWFGSKKQVKTAFGVEVLPHKDIPDGVALVVACLPEDPTVVLLSLRLEINNQESDLRS